MHQQLLKGTLYTPLLGTKRERKHQTIFIVILKNPSKREKKEMGFYGESWASACGTRFLLFFIILTVLKTDISVDAQICTLGWKLYKDTYISTDLTKRKYHDARQNCRNIGGTELLMPKTTEENDFLAHISCSPPSELFRYWIGMTDKETENVFEWEDGTYEHRDNWAPREPNNIFNQDCAAFITSPDANKHGKWSTQKCNIALFSLCSKPLRLPSLKSGPELKDVGSSFAVLTWQSWNKWADVGQGPIAGYLIDIKIDGEKEWRNVGFDVNAGIAHQFDIDASHEFNVTGLAAGTNYQVTIVLLHGDSGRMGAPSPSIHVATSGVPASPLPPAPCSLTSAPVIRAIGTMFLTVGWKTWQENHDIGDGPVAAYLVNIRAKCNGGGKDADWVNVGAIPAGNDVRLSTVGASGKPGTEMTFNVTHLQPGMTYEIMVSLIQGALGTEGPASPPLVVTTLKMGSSNGSSGGEGGDNWTPGKTCDSVSPIQQILIIICTQCKPITMVALLALGIGLVVLAIVGVVTLIKMCSRGAKRKNTHPRANDQQELLSRVYADQNIYEEPPSYYDNEKPKRYVEE